jgi:hypothetical protein
LELRRCGASNKVGGEPARVSPQEFAIFIAAETEPWSALVAAANIKMDRSSSDLARGSTRLMDRRASFRLAKKI